jgi:glycosyltransferase involved in cell wall biosynthesis
MTTTINFDNIIYTLQKNGGASLFWSELTTRVENDARFKVKYTNGSNHTRLFPVYSDSDIFHSSHFRTSFPMKSKVISTIHDLTYEKGLIATSRMGKMLNTWERKNSVKRSDIIVCISENTKREMLDIYPCTSRKTIHVILHGCSFNRNKLVSIKTTKRLIESAEKLDKFVLYVGARYSYKNFNSALVGFSKSILSKDGFSLICTGASFNQTETAFIQKLGLAGKIFVLDNVTSIELSYLYQNAFALIYPSTYEGFGLPPLEAMSSGSPVIAANKSSIPEVVGNAGILIDDIENPEAIARALENLLDNQTRDTLILKGLERAKLFTWEKAAEAYMQAYQSAVNS